MTYSIVARDAKSGQLGVAVQSHWFAVGPIVPWAEAGVGAVATQAFADPAYGPMGLALMRAGRRAPDALRALLAGDDGRASRQVAMVDAGGAVAVHTGERCITAAGHLAGDGFTVQANMMSNDTVWPAMQRAFQAATGDLAERLLAALDAAESAGGDVRGRQSAALLVVAGASTNRPWIDRLFDVRVDDAPHPLVELRRLVRLQRAYLHMNAGDGFAEKQDFGAAEREYRAAAALYPDNPELVYWHAIALAGAGRVDEAVLLLARVLGGADGKRWRELTARLPAAGLLPNELLARLLAAS